MGYVSARRRKQSKHLGKERKFRKYGHIDNDQNEDDQEKESRNKLVERSKKKKLASLK